MKEKTIKTGTPLLRVSNATKVFRTNGTSFSALGGVDLDIQESEFVAITGESGSGKSTLLSLMGGIAPPTDGDVLVDGISIYGLPLEKQADFRREFIGFVFQQFHLLPYLTALENVMLPLTVAGKKDMNDLATRALANVGLESKASRLPSALSGGEQQRVAIARALVNEPPIILADEPTGNLDTATGEDVFSLLSELNSEGQTIIIVTHNHDIAARTHRAIHMKDGLVIADEYNRQTDTNDSKSPLKEIA